MELLGAGREAYERRDVPGLRDAIAELVTFRSTAEARQVGLELGELLDALEPRSGERNQHEDQACRRCGMSIHQLDPFYCGTCSPALWKRIEKEATYIAKAAAPNFHVGRTALPARRLLEHLFESQRDTLSILHWADSLEEAEHFEPRIYSIVRRYAKTHQKEPRMGGDFSRSHHAIYVSWNASTPGEGEQRVGSRVTTLPGQRCWPVPASSFEVYHLRSLLSPEEAERVLIRFKGRENAYLDQRKPQR
jgi:ribosomal protein L37E